MIDYNYTWMNDLFGLSLPQNSDVAQKQKKKLERECQCLTS